ncbi:hypothetical protein ACQ4PT_012296 [Festuca glaucescens]
MERVEDLLGSLKLSEAEAEGLRVGGKEMDVLGKKQLGQMDPKAVGKVFSEKPASEEGLKQALGNIWCPLKGIRCRRMGDNIFMFTFMQASGKRKALDNGPWNLNNELVVVMDFDPNKTIEEYMFDTIPIWIRVFKLPLGRMDRATGEMIGDKVGEWVDVEVGEDGYASGEYLRIKVKLDITKPLMRGMMMQFGEEGRARWCPFEYEFLPEYCYTCGILGHEARGCEIRLKRGEKQQYGPWLRAFIPRKAASGDRQTWSGGNGSSSGGRSYGFGIRKGVAGSNSLSWRKEEKSKVNSGSGEKETEADDQEAIRPLKKSGSKNLTNPVPRKNLEIDVGGMDKGVEGSGPRDEVHQQGEARGVERVHPSKEIVEGEQAGTTCRETVMEDKGRENPVHDTVHVEGAEGVHGERNANKQLSTFRRRGRKGAGSDEKLGVRLGTKRDMAPMEVDGEEGVTLKKGKVTLEETNHVKAGLSEQLCKSQ